MQIKYFIGVSENSVEMRLEFRIFLFVCFYHIPWKTPCPMLTSTSRLYVVIQ